MALIALVLTQHEALKDDGLVGSRVQVAKSDMSATSTARTIWRGDQAHTIQTQAARLAGPLQQRTNHGGTPQS
jgi:hypothetical protein